MSITQSITTLPAAPDPATDTPAQFSTKAAASVLAQKDMVTELQTWTTQVNVLSGELNSAAAVVTAAETVVLNAQAVCTAAAATAQASVTITLNAQAVCTVAAVDAFGFAETAAYYALQAQCAANQATAALAVASLPSAMVSDSFLHANSAGGYEFVLNSAMCDEIGAISTAQLGVASGVATLNSAGELHTAQRWDISGSRDTLLETFTVTAALVNIDFLTSFNTAYHDIGVELDQITFSAGDTLAIRLANSGVADGGSNYSCVTTSVYTNVGSVNVLAQNLGSSWQITGQSVSVGGGLKGTYRIRFYSVRDTSGNITGMARYVHHANGTVSEMQSGNADVKYKKTASASGLRLFLVGGNSITGGEIRIYGRSR